MLSSLPSSVETHLQPLHISLVIPFDIFPVINMVKSIKPFEGVSWNSHLKPEAQSLPHKNFLEGSQTKNYFSAGHLRTKSLNFFAVVVEYNKFSAAALAKWEKIF